MQMSLTLVKFPSMYKPLFFTFFLFIIMGRSFALDLSTQEAEILEKFFCALIEKSEGGYVLLGKKPICIHGFRVEDYFVQENERHLLNVYLREGSTLWKKLKINDKDENVVIHIYEKPDTLVKNCIHILFINKELCLNVIKNNLYLFQYVLGPDVTPSALLDKLINPNESFHHVLKEDKVLIGILLGFGAQNSLYVSRIENLENALFSRENPPFKSYLSKMPNVRSEFLEMLLWQEASISSKMNSEPSFGYSSLQQEMQKLTEKIEVSSPTLARETPSFIFGRLKNDEETNKLIVELEASQKEIKNLLSSGSFLQDVFKILYPKEKITILSSDSDLLNKHTDKPISFLVAANIWRILSGETESYQNSFIEGMKSIASHRKIPQSLDGRKYEKLKALVKINKNLQEAEDYFNCLGQDPHITCISPQRLYFKTIRSGQGKSVDFPSKILLHYSIKGPSGQVYADTFTGGQPCQVDLSDMISGFMWGIRGMKIGEEREIYIHPGLAYGIYTTFDKGVYLVARVRLLEIEDNCKQTFPPIKELDINLSSNVDADFQQEAKAVGLLSGYESWSHYGKSDRYTLDEILKWIELFKTKAIGCSLSKEDQDAINQLHWKIYKEQD